MQLKTFVKASKINNLSDARYFAAYSVDYLSFDCNSISIDYTSASSLKEIAQWVSGPKLCAEVVGLSIHEIEELLKQIAVDAIEIDSSQLLSPAWQSNYTIFKQILIHRETTVQEIQAAMHDADFYVLNFRLSSITYTDLQQGTPFTIQELNRLSSSFPVILDINVSPSHLHSLLNIPVHGITIHGGQEEKVGIRSFEDVQDIMEALEVYD